MLSSDWVAPRALAFELGKCVSTGRAGVSSGSTAPKVAGEQQGRGGGAERVLGPPPKAST